MAVVVVNARNGSEALKLHPGIIARSAENALPGVTHRFYVFEKIDDAIGHHSRVVCR